MRTETLEEEERRLGALVQACKESIEQGRRFDEIHERLSEVRGCFVCAEAGDGSRCMECIVDSADAYDGGF